MASKRRGLGRGLDALLSDTATASVSDDAVRMRDMPVDLLQPGKYQPRVDMHPESLEDLANSIRAQGVVQPIVVRPIADGKYEIIAGERRWRAAQMAALHDIPVVVREVDDSTAVAMSLIENIQREDLNPLEQAHALTRLIEEFDMTHQLAADAIGRSRATVSNLLRLLELEDAVKKLVQSGDLEMGHARALLALKGADQVEAANRVAKRGLSVRETERFVKHFSRGSKSKTPPQIDPNIQRFENDLTERLGATVSIQHTAKGKGKLVISYNSLDELDGILKHIK